MTSGIIDKTERVRLGPLRTQRRQDPRMAPDGEGEWRRPTSEANRALRISATRAILMTGRQGRDPRNPVKSRPATCNRGRITA